MSPQMLAVVNEAEHAVGRLPQIAIATEHLFHGGMYARTVRIPAQSVITGTLLNIPTILIIHGNAKVLTNAGWIEIEGYAVLPGSAGRKQAFVALSTVEMTMVFPTQAKTVEDAERECTDEFEKLISRRSDSDIVVVTEE